MNDNLPFYFIEFFKNHQCAAHILRTQSHEWEIEMQMLRRFINDESNTFAVEAGLIVMLIAMVILLRVVQFAHGS